MTEEAVTPEVLPALPPPDGIVHQGPRGGLMYLAEMPEAQFAAQMEALKVGQDRVRLIQKTLMKPEEDYGVIADRITIYKAGSEKLLQFYRLAADTNVDIRYGDGVKEPRITVLTLTTIHVGDTSGPVVAVGVGASTSWEKKYRWRKGERACPACGVAGSVIKGNPQYAPRDNDGAKEPGYEQGGWLCWKKKDGCGKNFTDKDAAIISQSVSKEENPDQYDLLNTLVKMSKKRSLVDGTLQATATSGLFGQDLEDLDEETKALMEAAKKTRGGQPKGSTKPKAEKKRAPKKEAKKDTPAGHEGQPAGEMKDAAPNGDEEYKTWPEDRLCQELTDLARIVAKAEHGDDSPGVTGDVLQKYSTYEGQFFRDATPEVAAKWLRWTYRNLRQASKKHISKQVDETLGKGREPGEEG